ncbi:sterol desaturase family protein [Collimonas silvisoli]|uniref:sterol desaturase family protein n=1 Tax=Collimonas silvisoli TaxID=2825884 RepID=UPI001B8BD383|nr:sterol desaturase family protein [Collimonas silvisoli]
MESHHLEHEKKRPVIYWRTVLTQVVRYCFYPASLLLTLSFIHSEIAGQLGILGKAYPTYLALLIGTMLTLEWLVPSQKRWSMTWRKLLQRDLPMLAINGVAIYATSSAVTALAFWMNPPSVAYVQLLPWWVQAGCAILLSDFIWYWVHRHSHEGTGRMGRWLWKTHALHHLPDQVYVFMHAAGHPINSACVRIILMLPAIALGLPKEAAFAATVLTGFQGLISHFNVDIRAGWFNRLFMGTELHRYHHSAAPSEGRNYAAVITLWDQLFGTFDYHPKENPEMLGVHDRSKYPQDHQWSALMILPFKSDRADGECKS